MLEVDCKVNKKHKVQGYNPPPSSLVVSLPPSPLPPSLDVLLLWLQPSLSTGLQNEVDSSARSHCPSRVLTLYNFCLWQVISLVYTKNNYSPKWRWR